MAAVFDLDKALVRTSFSGAAETYDGMANLQRNIGRTLLAGQPKLLSNDSVLDLGCGTGFMGEELFRLGFSGHLVALDLALPMLMAFKSKQKFGRPTAYLCADADCLPFKRESFDILFSNLALQWCRDLSAVCLQAGRILKPGGRFVWSTFGPLTLFELRLAWSEVDSYVHVNRFHDPESIEAFLTRAGFVNIHITSRPYISYYDQAIDLLQELKGLGAHNTNHGRNHTMTGKTKFHSMLACYESKRTEFGLPATFEAIFVEAEIGR